MPRSEWEKFLITRCDWQTTFSLITISLEACNMHVYTNVQKQHFLPISKTTDCSKKRKSQP